MNFAHFCHSDLTTDDLDFLVARVPGAERKRRSRGRTAANLFRRSRRFSMDGRERG